MKRLSLLFVVCMVSMLAFAQTESTANSTSQDDNTGIAETASGVTLTPSSLNFGSVKIPDGHKYLVATLTNNQSVSLHIISIVAKSDRLPHYQYSETDNCPWSLGPHSSCAITVDFNPLVLNEIDGSLTVTDNGPGSPQITTLTGYGVRDCYPTCPN